MEEGSWISGRDEDGPYVKRGDQWIGYEDPISMKIKAAYIRSNGLAGISLWSLDLDDFQVFIITSSGNKCNEKFCKHIFVYYMYYTGYLW